MIDRRYRATLLAYLAAAGLPATLGQGADGLLELELAVEGQAYQVRLSDAVPVLDELQDFLWLVLVACPLFVLLGAWLSRLELLPRPGGGLVARLAWPDTAAAHVA